MRNGTLPYQIMRDLDRRRVRLVRTGQLVKTHGSIQTVSRALRRLVKEDRLEAIAHGIYRVLPGGVPALAFDRAWSNPGATFSADKLIAITLARPTFQDIARLCRAYGVERVRGVLGSLASAAEVPESRASEWQHRLMNIQAGFKDELLSTKQESQAEPAFGDQDSFELTSISLLSKVTLSDLFDMSCFLASGKCIEDVLAAVRKESPYFSYEQLRLKLLPAELAPSDTGLDGVAFEEIKRALLRNVDAYERRLAAQILIEEDTAAKRMIP